MPRFAEVTHCEWIAAPVDTVRAQFADLEHHIRLNVHPKLRFELLQLHPRGARFVQEVRLPLPPVIGLLLRPLLEAQTRKGVRAAPLEDKRDIEALGYPAVRPALAAS